MVHGFALQSGGALTIESDPAEGTLVTIFIPATDAGAASEALEASFEATSALAGPKVLLVEDDNSVRRAIELLLGKSGFDVVSAEDGDTAMEHLNKVGPPDILLTDQSMPGTLQGLDLARFVKARWPGTPVVLMSGYADRIDNEPGIPFLQKPVSRRTLVTALNNGLRRDKAA